MTPRLVALAVLGGLLAVLVPAGHAQPEKAELKSSRPAQPQPSRKLYPLRHADPATLAAVVEKHVGSAGVVTVTGQGLLVTSVGQGEEIGKLIEQLDRPQRQVAVVVTLAEVVTKDRLAELKGDPDQILARLVEMSVTGQASLKRVTLTGAEGQPVTTTSGGDRPIADGGVGFKGARSVMYRPLATTVKTTARVLADGVVAVDLSVKDTSARPPGEEGYASFDTVDLTTRVTVPPGRAVLAQAVEEKDKTARATVIVVSARVAEPGK